MASYSARIEGFLVARGQRFRVAKSNDQTVTLAEACELPPGTECDIVVIIDGNRSSLRVILPDGIAQGKSTVSYKVVAPF